MPSRGGNAQVQRQPAVVVVAVAEPARRRARRRRAKMPVKSSASFRMTVLPMVVALVLVWALHFRSGVSWERTSNPLLVYTAHPLFMVIGFVICTGEGKRESYYSLQVMGETKGRLRCVAHVSRAAVMAYRIVLGPRPAKKMVHLLLHLVAMAFAAVGLYAAFKYHHDTGLPDLRSLHSWIGIATIALYALQVSESHATRMMLFFVVTNL